MKIAITGSNGFIGNELVAYLLQKGHQVLLLQRKQPATLSTGATYQFYDLQQQTLPDITGIDALVHAAYMPATKGVNATYINITGSIALYEECVRKGVDYVFLSSMSAHSEALSDYGKYKYDIEQILQHNGNCLVLKLGLVLGAKGLFSRIQASVKKTSLAVMVGGGGQPIQTIYIKDVVRVVEKCILNKVKGIYTLATPQVYSMKQLFAFIAASNNRKLLFIPVPYWVAQMGISFVELLRLPFPVSNENLLGLKQLKALPTEADLKKLDVTLADLQESIRLLS